MRRGAVVVTADARVAARLSPRRCRRCSSEGGGTQAAACVLCRTRAALVDSRVVAPHDHVHSRTRRYPERRCSRSRCSGDGVWQNWKGGVRGPLSAKWEGGIWDCAKAAPEHEARRNGKEGMRVSLCLCVCVCVRRGCGCERVCILWEGGDTGRAASHPTAKTWKRRLNCECVLSFFLFPIRHTARVCFCADACMHVCMCACVRVC